MLIKPCSSGVCQVAGNFQACCSGRIRQLQEHLSIGIDDERATTEPTGIWTKQKQAVLKCSSYPTEMLQPHGSFFDVANEPGDHKAFHLLDRQQRPAVRVGYQR